MIQIQVAISYEISSGTGSGFPSLLAITVPIDFIFTQHASKKTTVLCKIHLLSLILLDCPNSNPTFYILNTVVP